MAVRRAVVAATQVAEGGVRAWASADRRISKTDHLRSLPATVGHGAHRYDVDATWGVPGVPGDHPVRDAHEMVQASDGRIFLLTNDPRNNVLVYDRDGTVVGSWTLGLRSAHGLTLVREADGEVLWISAPNEARVVKTDLTGRVLQELPPAWTLPLGISPVRYLPTQTAVAANGDVFVADGYGTSLVIRYASDGTYLGHFGGRGKADTSLNCAHGIAVDARGGDETLLVSSREDCCFKRFSLDGALVEVIELPGAYVCRPVIKGDLLYAGACWSGRMLRPNSGFVVIVDREGRVVSAPGAAAPRYEGGVLQALRQESKLFLHCHDVCVDDDGSIYVAQWNSGGAHPMKLTPTER